MSVKKDEDYCTFHPQNQAKTRTPIGKASITDDETSLAHDHNLIGLFCYFFSKRESSHTASAGANEGAARVAAIGILCVYSFWDEYIY